MVFVLHFKYFCELFFICGQWICFFFCLEWNLNAQGNVGHQMKRYPKGHGHWKTTLMKNTWCIWWKRNTHQYEKEILDGCRKRKIHNGHSYSCYACTPKGLDCQWSKYASNKYHSNHKERHRRSKFSKIMSSLFWKDHQAPTIWIIWCIWTIKERTLSFEWSPSNTVCWGGEGTPRFLQQI